MLYACAKKHSDPTPSNTSSDVGVNQPGCVTKWYPIKFVNQLSRTNDVVNVVFYNNFFNMGHSADTVLVGNGWASWATGHCTPDSLPIHVYGIMYSSLGDYRGSFDEMIYPSKVSLDTIVNGQEMPLSHPYSVPTVINIK